MTEHVILTPEIEELREQLLERDIRVEIYREETGLMEWCVSIWKDTNRRTSSRLLYAWGATPLEALETAIFEYGIWKIGKLDL